MQNFSYKRFLAVAREELEYVLASAKKETDAIGLSFTLDEGFPWTGKFQNAVGRCGHYDEDATFNISVHFKAIFHSIRESVSEAFLFDNELWWEKEIAFAIQTTVKHEIAHGIFEYFRDISCEDDDFWNWCIENGFDKTLFCSDCDNIDFEEAIAEEYATSFNSLLDTFLDKYENNYN